jgi:hypothetical protein
MSDCYIDSSIPEMEDREPIRNPGVKLSPNEHSRFYDDVPGMSEARSQLERPKEVHPLASSVTRCCEHPEGEGDFQLFGGVASEW